MYFYGISLLRRINNTKSWLSSKIQSTAIMCGVHGGGSLFSLSCPPCETEFSNPLWRRTCFLKYITCLQIYSINSELRGVELQAAFSRQLFQGLYQHHRAMAPVTLTDVLGHPQAVTQQGQVRGSGWPGSWSFLGLESHFHVLKKTEHDLVRTDTECRSFWYLIKDYPNTLSYPLILFSIINIFHKSCFNSQFV